LEFNTLEINATIKIDRYNMLMRFTTLKLLSIVLSIFTATTKIAWPQELQYLNGELENGQQPPRFKIEIIAFSYNEFDSSEEKFSIKSNSRLIKAPPHNPIKIVGTELYKPKNIHSLLPVLQTESDLLINLFDPLFDISVIDPLNEDSPLIISPEYLIAVQENLRLVDSLKLRVLKNSSEYHGYKTRVLDQDELELKLSAARLNRLNAYTVLAHGGWIQAGLSEEKSIPMEIWKLDSLNPIGTVKLHLSRFLHLTVALDFYSEELKPLGIPTNLENITLTPAHELRATRRARSGELHYFDHPAFGILVSVEPAPPEPELSEESNDLITPLLGPAA
tara:strand:- start:2106 stop:3110 length:1005 start_codon:yes stop_codon:yes gene_type:complete